MLSQTLTRACENANKPVLRLGDQGTDVLTLRKLLAASERGYGGMGLTLGDSFHGTIEVMVKDFQRQVFLVIDGIVGPKTWKALCADAPIDMPELSRGNDAGLTEIVKLAQERLAWDGHYTGAIDGDFGPLTHAAVVQFQKSSALEPDGIIGPITWKMLSFVRQQTTV